MSYRFMRMLVFFDLPMVEPEDRRSYAQFHQMMCITEKQFARMEWIVGEHHSEIVDSDDRLVIL